MLVLSEAIARFLRVDRASTTRQSYRCALSRLADALGPDRPLATITPDDLDDFVAALRSGGRYAHHPRRRPSPKPLADSTIRLYVTIVKVLFAWCVRRQYLSETPAFDVRLRQSRVATIKDRAATSEEVSAILGAASHPRNRAIVSLLAQSGCRASDIANLRRDNLDLAAQMGFVVGKGGKKRRFVFGLEAAQALRAWLETKPLEANPEYIFTNLRGPNRGRAMKAASVSNLIRSLCKRAGLPRLFGSHAFRHYVGMKLATNNVPVHVIQRYLGHSSVESTMLYLRAVDDDLYAAVPLLALHDMRS